MMSAIEIFDELRAWTWSTIWFSVFRCTRHRPKPEKIALKERNRREYTPQSFLGGTMKHFLLVLSLLCVTLISSTAFADHIYLSPNVGFGDNFRFAGRMNGHPLFLFGGTPSYFFGTDGYEPGSTFGRSFLWEFLRSALSVKCSYASSPMCSISVSTPLHSKPLREPL
jgi:hypothetical protein